MHNELQGGLERRMKHLHAFKDLGITSRTGSSHSSITQLLVKYFDVSLMRHILSASLSVNPIFMTCEIKSTWRFTFQPLHLIAQHPPAVIHTNSSPLTARNWGAPWPLEMTRRLWHRSPGIMCVWTDNYMIVKVISKFLMALFYWIHKWCFQKLMLECFVIIGRGISLWLFNVHATAHWIFSQRIANSPFEVYGWVIWLCLICEWFPSTWHVDMVGLTQVPPWDRTRFCTDHKSNYHSQCLREGTPSKKEWCAL
jgi:hypothetical protein